MSKSRAWCFTLQFSPDGPSTPLALITILRVKLPSLAYVIAGLEVAPTTGQKHFQGFLYLAHPVGMKTLKNCPILAPAHLEVKSVHSTFNQAASYCEKEGNFEQWGVRPMDKEDKGKKSKEQWDQIVRLAMSNEVDKIGTEYPSIFVSHYNSLQRIASANPVRPKTLPFTAGVWIHGASGSGKSHLVRDLGHEIYDKLSNKWWCGYRDENIVLIDDLSPESGEHLQTFLKRWTDKYSFTAETKGGSRTLRPPMVVITSQYSIESCFPGCTETIAALSRRCTNLTLSVANRPLIAAVLQGLVDGRLAQLAPQEAPRARSASPASSERNELSSGNASVLGQPRSPVSSDCSLDSWSLDQQRYVDQLLSGDDLSCSQRLMLNGIERIE